MSLQDDKMIISADSDYYHAIDVLKKYSNVVKLQTVRKLMIQIIQDPGNWGTAGMDDLKEVDYLVQKILSHVSEGASDERAKHLYDTDTGKMV